MPELPREAYEDKLPPVMKDGSLYPWWVRFLPIVWTTIWTNPMTAIGLAAIGVLCWQSIEGTKRTLDGQRRLAEEIQSRYVEMETRREAREDKADARTASSIEKLVGALDKNTDAVRGKVFMQKTTDSKKDVKKSPPD